MMAENILEVYELTKMYNHFTALDHISITIEKGAVYGLIGQNGAGKSTLMKLISDLAHPSSGSFKLFGHVPNDHPYVYRRVGVLIENSGLYPSLNAFDNMKMKSLAMGCFNRAKILDLLALCGLKDCGSKLTKNFSMGMKQRLGIAMALLNNPEFLILDEPTNGLDPQGILEIRNLLIKLNREQGLTLLISSHILEELSKIATHYAIIKNGRLVECLTSDELFEKCKDCLEIHVDDSSKAVLCLEQQCGVINYNVLAKNVIHIYDHYDKPEIIVKELVIRDVLVYNITMNKLSLEDYYLKKCGDEDVD